MAWSAVIENYCKQRAAHANNGKEELQKQYEANHIIYEKAIKMFLRNTWEKAKADKSMSCYSNDFIRFCLYVRDGTSLTTAEMIRLDQLKIKKDLTFKNIDSLETGDVKKLCNTLNEIANIAKTVYSYKTLKEKKTNKQK